MGDATPVFDEIALHRHPRGKKDRSDTLLTSLSKENTYKSLWQVVGGYLSRWRAEDTIRYIKQAYNLEDVQ